MCRTRDPTHAKENGVVERQMTRKSAGGVEEARNAG